MALRTITATDRLLFDVLRWTIERLLLAGQARRFFRKMDEMQAGISFSRLVTSSEADCDY